MIKTILKKIGLKYGLIGGVASVVVSLIIFYALKGHSPYPIQKLLSNITTAVFMTLGIYAYKYSIAERPLRLPQAFLSGAIVVLVSVVTSALLFYISLKLLIENPTTAWAGAALVGYNGSSTIFSDRYHYIENKKGGYELYDLETDPNEWTNVVDDPAYQEIRKKMKAGMDAMQKDHIENPFEGVSF